jgi:hypothetical protein
MRNDTNRLRNHRIDGAIFTRYFLLYNFHPYVLPSVLFILSLLSLSVQGLLLINFARGTIFASGVTSQDSESV